MDLSTLTAEDLDALSKGDYEKVSLDGLNKYQQHLQDQISAYQQAKNPKQIPDAADKAAQNNNPNSKPISLLSQLTNKQSWDNASRNAANSWANLTPEQTNRMGAGLNIPSAPALNLLKQGLSKLGSGLGSTMGEGVANDVLGMISPRAAKLANFLGKISSKSPPLDQAEEAVSSQTSTKLDRLTSAAKPKIDPFKIQKRNQ